MGNNNKSTIKKLIESNKDIQKKVAELKITVDQLLDKPDFNALYAAWKAENQAIPDIPPVVVDQEPEPTPEVPPVVVPPTPTPTEGLPDLSKGTVLFDSTVIWANGHDRTMTDHHEFDVDDPKTEVAAGGHGTPRVWHVDGKGNSELSGGMSRVYNHSPHQGTIAILQKFIFNSTLENMSYEFFSRHNEGGEFANRTGGMQCAFHLKEIGSKFESYHAVYHDNGTKAFPTPIKVGDTVSIAIIATKDANNYTLTAYMESNGKYTEVGNFKHTETENKAGTIPQPLYWRWRVNGTAPTKVKAWDTKFIQL